MDKQSRTLLWEKMSKQYVATEDLQPYSLDELKKLEDRLNNFVERFRQLSSSEEGKFMKIFHDLIAWGVFTSIISFIGILVGISSYEVGFGIQQFLYFGFVAFVFYNMISRIVYYSENKALYRFVNSKFYQDNRKNLRSRITIK
jgi:hypothetical protein